MICVPILAASTAEAMDKTIRGSAVADMIELRLDMMEGGRSGRTHRRRHGSRARHLPFPA